MKMTIEVDCTPGGGARASWACRTSARSTSTWSSEMQRRMDANMADALARRADEELDGVRRPAPRSSSAS